MFRFFSYNSDLIPFLISVIVLSILFFSIYVTIKYRNPEQYKETRYNVFFSSLASAAIIFVGINILLSSVAYKHNQEFLRLNKTKESVDRFWLYPNQLLGSSKQIRPEFRASFFRNNPEIYSIAASSNTKTPLTVEGIIQEQLISNIIFQGWEDSLTVHGYNLTPFELWLRSFIVWAQSPYLKFYYNKFIYGYRIKTKSLGDLLFKYAETLPVPVTNLEDYDKTVKKMMKDPDFITLMKSLP